MRKFLCLLAIILCTGNVYAVEMGHKVSLHSPKVYYTHRFGSISDALDIIGSSNPALLYLDSTVPISSAVTITDNITIRYSGGKFQEVGTGTITFDGSLDAPPVQIFEDFEAGDVTGLKVSYPEWFGAVGDLSVDDTTAIQSALGSVDDGIVILNNGRYTVTSTLSKTLVAGKRFNIIGYGFVELVSSINEPGAESGILQITGTTTSDFGISNITITHSAGAVGNLDGIYLKTAFRSVEINNTKVTGVSKWGISAETADRMDITNCIADSNKYGGLGMRNCSNVVVLGGSYSNNGDTAPTNGYGVSCETSALGFCSDVLIQGLKCENNKRKGIDIHNGQNVVIKGNFVTGFESAGIYAVNEGTTKNVKNITITGSHIDGTGASGSNTIYGVEIGSYGTSALTPEAFMVVDNIISECDANVTSSSILIRNSQGAGVSAERIVVANNIINNGAGSSAYVIRGDNSGNVLGTVNISNNIVHSTSCLVAIGILESNRTIINGNTIIIDSGTTTYGITTSASDHSIISGNNIEGSATFTTPIRIFASAFQTARQNMLQGVMMADTLASGVILTQGTGSPDSVVTAPVGSLYIRTDGGTGTAFYIKETGTSTTGWVAK